MNYKAIVYCIITSLIISISAVNATQYYFNPNTGNMRVVVQEQYIEDESVIDIIDTFNNFTIYSALPNQALQMCDPEIANILTIDSAHIISNLQYCLSGEGCNQISIYDLFKALIAFEEIIKPHSELANNSELLTALSNLKEGVLADYKALTDCIGLDLVQRPNWVKALPHLKEPFMKRVLHEIFKSEIESPCSTLKKALSSDSLSKLSEVLDEASFFRDFEVMQILWGLEQTGAPNQSLVFIGEKHAEHLHASLVSLGYETTDIENTVSRRNSSNFSSVNTSIEEDADLSMHYDPSYSRSFRR